MWNAFVNWFTEVIKFMYQLTGSIGLPNYGLAIILISIAIKLVLFPLTQKQMKSMREMQEIQPRMKYLQTQYKDDPQMMQRKLQELYKEHGVNPFGGCLPLLIQMPILFAFYQSLFKLSKAFTPADHVIFLGINIGHAVQSPYWVTWILPALVAATTYYQQKISMADTNDPTQKTMLYMMPLFIGYISSTVAAGLPLYWVTFNVLSIAQQLYVNSTTKKLAVAGAGITIDVQEIGTPEKVEEPGEKKEAGRDKGGTSQDGGPNRRKKGKKH